MGSLGKTLRWFERPGGFWDVAFRDTKIRARKWSDFPCSPFPLSARDRARVSRRFLNLYDVKVSAILALLVAGALGTSCVSIKSVDEDQVPAAWRQATSGKNDKRADVNGQFFANGQVVRSDGKVVNWTMLDLFFPGRYLSRHQPQLDRCELHLGASGRLTFTGFLGGAVILTDTFDTEVDRETGALIVKSIPVSDQFDKFGRVASTRNARLQIGSDHALYGYVRQSGVGIVLFMPVAGTSSMVARWDAVPP